jgi:hypothetical protein
MCECVHHIYLCLVVSEAHELYKFNVAPVIVRNITLMPNKTSYVS